ncbi:hypothetical protein EAH89_21335 [Roseomonas nepalensis]|uniref:Uncharacterized protein n=2 Tax=Muricoccus nepalensis TaxID=1854500 RepID=A0A502FJC7_9PROT|nr:hypothetical protein EAH89_21335 [Roseomonas nepalensis]
MMDVAREAQATISPFKRIDLQSVRRHLDRALDRLADERRKEIAALMIDASDLEGLLAPVALWEHIDSGSQKSADHLSRDTAPGKSADH